MKSAFIRALLPVVYVLLPAWACGGPAGPVTWGQSSFVGGGWGRMARLGNGEWLCVTTEYPAGTNSYLRLQRSPDAGRTWFPMSEVKEAGRTLDNGELVTLPGGTMLLTMRSLIPGASYRLPVYASNDQGDTWAYRSTIDASEDLGESGLWEPDFQVLEGGRLIVTYSNEKHPGYSQLISLKVSDDDGITWGAESWAVYEPGGGGLRPGMSQMARMADGRYILVYEVVGSGNADVHCKFSDDGETWPEGLGTRIPCQHCGPFVTSLPNGLLLVSSCENEVSFSEDFGLSWQKIDPPAWDYGFLFSWPAIYVTAPDEVGVMVVPEGVRIRFGDLAPRVAWPNPYLSTFNRGSDVGWVRYGGTFALENGEYRLLNEGTYGKALAGEGFWTDGVLEADVMLTSPGNAGLMFRTTNPDYAGPDHAFGYYAGVDTSGAVVLGRMDNAWTALASAGASIITGAWYRLKVELEDDTIAVYLEDVPEPAITHIDGTFRRGQIGVRSYQCDARFDNVWYSNAVPPRVRLDRSDDGLAVSWPETSVATQLHAATSMPPDQAQAPVPHPYVLSNGQWVTTLDAPPEDKAFYWLQGE